MHDSTGSLTHPTETNSAPLSRRWSGTTLAWLAALLGWTIVVVTYDLGGGAKFEPTDCWVAQTAREMREANDWVVPRYAGRTRLHKTPGAYWAVMLASLARGQPVDEIAARLPNAVAGLAIVLSVFLLTRRIAGDRAAVYAGFAAASSTMVLYWSHRAASDMGLAACTTVSLVCLWIASADEPPGWRRTLLWLAGYFMAGIGMLYKGPMPLACVGLPAVAYLLIQRRWRVLASGWHLVGLAVFLAPWLPWVVSVVRMEPLAVAKWDAEFVDRFTGDLPNVEFQFRWFYYFFYLIPIVVYTMPYAGSLPAAFLRAIRPPAQVNRDGIRFVLIWFLSLLAFFTAATGKETRYFLPALPPLFVLLGIELAEFFSPTRAVSPARLRVVQWLVWAVAPLAVAGAAWAAYRWHRHEQLFAWREVWPPVLIAASLIGGGAMLAAWMFGRGRREGAFAMLVAATWMTWMWTWSCVMPIFASQRQFFDFVEQVRERLDEPTRARLMQVGQHDSRIVWYGDLRYPRLIDQFELLRRLGGERSLAREMRLIGEEILQRLEGSEPVLLVASRPDFVLFLAKARDEMEAAGKPMPPVHLWIQTRIGRPARHFVVFSNQPPPWPEPELTPPARMLESRRTGTQPAH